MGVLRCPENSDGDCCDMPLKSKAAFAVAAGKSQVAPVSSFALPCNAEGRSKKNPCGTNIQQG
ncbi:MAG: hypothetical protein DWH78_04815 [Planctomycetota bacterium]|nr:MAG: hypothetical protein DWH78_04815 [Planctomycetota bacterium]